LPKAESYVTIKCKKRNFPFKGCGVRNIVTANGTGYLEFTRELLLALKADTQEKIEAFYDFSKNGLVR
jgi:hypothetical protein